MNTLAGLPAWPGLLQPPRCTPQFLTPPRPVPGRPRPTCKVSALYLENCANASRQTETDRQSFYRYRYRYMHKYIWMHQFHAIAGTVRLACMQQIHCSHACIDFLTYSDDHPSRQSGRDRLRSSMRRYKWIASFEMALVVIGLNKFDCDIYTQRLYYNTIFQ